MADFIMCTATPAPHSASLPPVPTPGVPLHMPNKMGARCIHTASQRGHVGVVNAILHKGEHVDVTTNVRLGAAWRSPVVIPIPGIDSQTVP